MNSQTWHAPQFHELADRDVVRRLAIELALAQNMARTATDVALRISETMIEQSAKLADAQAVLRAVEWNGCELGQDEYPSTCPACSAPARPGTWQGGRFVRDMERQYRHASTCELARLLGRKLD